MENLKGVIISGASTGIGRGIALALAQRGYWAFAGVRRAQDAEALQAAAGTELSGRLTPVMLDVTDTASVQAARDQVEAALGGTELVGLVNNAAIAVSGPLEFLPLEALRKQLEVNVVGALAMVQEFAPLLRRSRGRVINVSSVGGFVSTAFQGPYCASKFALEALSDSLRRELQPWGIQVCLIQPGSTATPMWAKGTAAARETLADLPDAALQLYSDMAQRALQNAERTAERAVPVEVVVDKVYAALRAKRPRTRYRAGLDTQIMRVVSWLLPDRALDWFLRTATGV